MYRQRLKQSQNVHRFFNVNKKMIHVIKNIQYIIIIMFSYLLTNYNVLSANNQCIYEEYKICVLKYRKLKKICQDLQKQNSFMKKELKNLKNLKNEDILKDNNDEIRLIIQEPTIETFDNRIEIKINEGNEASVYINIQEYESENAYELV